MIVKVPLSLTAKAIVMPAILRFLISYVMRCFSLLIARTSPCVMVGSIASPSIG